MKDYKRLTERRGNLVIDKCGNCENVSNPQGCTEHCCYEVMKNRLAELEDKIENGTLIELPCEVGDLIYFVSKKNGIQFSTINEIKIHIDFTGIVGIEVRDDDYKWHTVNNRTIFFTREEAEKRLKELQE